MSAPPTLTATEARRSVVDVGRAVIAALGTSPWELVSGPGAEECDLGGGTRGIYLSWTARGPVSSDAAAVGKVAAAALQKQGYGVVVQKVSNGAVRVVGSSDRLGTAEFDAGSATTSINVTSRCVAGNRADFNDLPPEPPIPSSSAG